MNRSGKSKSIGQDISTIGQVERLRLSGIDCPEKGQAFGKQAKRAVADLAFGKEVTIQTHGHDEYKRTLGDVILPGGKNLNQKLVKQGWCWSDQNNAVTGETLEKLVVNA
jgi:micrococcal nuclease